MTTHEDRLGLATLTAHGYRVERWGRGWLLLDVDGSQLMVGEHGGVSPTRWEAVVEGLRRIGEDARHAAELGAAVKAGAELTHRRFVEDARAELARCERILRNLVHNGYDVGEFVYDSAVSDVAAARRELASLVVSS